MQRGSSNKWFYLLVVINIKEHRLLCAVCSLNNSAKLKIRYSYSKRQRKKQARRLMRPPNLESFNCSASVHKPAKRRVQNLPSKSLID